MIVAALLVALGEEYLTREQALKLVFPHAERVIQRTVELDEKTRRRVEERYGSGVAPRQEMFLGVREGKVSGYAMILTEITKTLPATFIVGVNPSGDVSEVAVMSHEDHIGADCRRKRFVDQFKGKTVDNRIAVPNGGILAVSGATLSCQAIARAVRKAVAIVQYHFVDQPGVAEAALQEEPVRQKRYLMGTFLTITAYGPTEAVERAFDAVKRLEKVLSNYDDKSELSRLQRERSIEASDDLIEFFRVALRYGEEMGGALDVTVAPLVRAWGFKDGKHRVPSPGEIDDLRKTVGLGGIELQGRTVRLRPGVEVDPGSIGKGMAVDRAAEVLRKAGIKRGFVDFGSSAVAIGTWDVAIRDPADGEKTLGVVVLHDESLSTAGSYEKMFEKEGKIYTHILDPRTGLPVEGVASVSIIAPTATESDARDTGVFVLKELPAGCPAMIVPARGAPVMNDAWKKKLKRADQ